jgi:hypothetical protein
MDSPLFFANTKVQDISGISNRNIGDEDTNYVNYRKCNGCSPEPDTTHGFGDYLI